MNDFIESLREWFKEKFNSPLYLTFLGFYVAWNWRFFQVVFLESDILFSTPRIEYINSELFFSIPLFLYEHTPAWLWAAEEWVMNLGWHILPPAVFTFLTVKYLPVVHSWAHNIYLDHYFSRKESYDKKESEYENKKGVFLKEIAAQRERQQQQRNRIEKTLTKEDRWENEFENIFQNQKDVNVIRKANQIIYGTGGRFTGNPSEHQQGFRPYIHPDDLSRLDSLNLISISKDKYENEMMKFTDKGKFFVRELQNRNKA